MSLDLAIAKKYECKPIVEIGQKIGLSSNNLECYGNYKAKINYQELTNEANAKVVLVTAISPTKAGEGKSTTTIGLCDALNALDIKAAVALREPSLGPVFGLKGGATGGGYAQVVPMEDINLHFTGDMHAITTCNNLISAVLDNSIYQENVLNINPERVVFKRVLDMNERTLRDITIAQGKATNGVERKDSFQITVASEVMAILCLATDIADLKERLGNILVAYTYDEKPIFVKDLGIVGACAMVLKDAIKPNLVQTLEGNPAIIHGGPFANIAHGCNSIIATKTAMRLADVVVTEAGFGADLGAEKFLDIKCQLADIKPNAVVLVATIRALKMHGEQAYDELSVENVEALERGLANLAKHIDTLKAFNLPYVIAINKFNTDTDAEVQVLLDFAKANNHPIALSEVYVKGSEGGLELGREVLKLIEEPNNFKPLYDFSEDNITKIKKIATTVYGAKDVIFSENALAQLKTYEELGFKDLAICMAKTPMSFSDDPTKLGAPKDFVINIQAINISYGAKFLVVLTGNVMTMPGLPKKPAALNMDLSDTGEVFGLF